MGILEFCVCLITLFYYVNEKNILDLELNPGTHACKPTALPTTPIPTPLPLPPNIEGVMLHCVVDILECVVDILHLMDVGCACVQVEEVERRWDGDNIH